MNAPKPLEFKPEEILGPLNEVERKNAPEMLYVLGDPDLLRRGVRVAIVGSRQASVEGRKRARRFARLLCERGIVVVSGLARGIDAEVHRSAIENQGRTIGVLGTSLDRTYPKENTELQQDVAKDHLLVSQFPTGTVTQRWHFPLRNRTMALISQASVVVEAGEGSGVLSQGWEALRLGRPLYLMESVVRNEALQWPQEMLRYGAEVLSDATTEEFIKEVEVRERGRESELAL